MSDLLALIFLLLSITFFIGIIIGLLEPTRVICWGETKTRERVLVIYTPLLIISLVLFVVFRVSAHAPDESEHVSVTVPANLKVFDVKNYLDDETKTLTPEKYEKCVNDIFMNVTNNWMAIQDVYRHVRAATTSDNEELAEYLQNIKDSADNFKAITPPAGYEDIHELTVLEMNEYSQYANIFPKDLNNPDYNAKYEAEDHFSQGNKIYWRVRELVKAKQDERRKQEQANRPE